MSVDADSFLDVGAARAGSANLMPIDRRFPVLIDCDSCTVRGAACADCVVTVLLGAPPDGVDLDATERTAIAALAEHGLVPPLRLERPAAPERRAAAF